MFLYSIILRIVSNTEEILWTIYESLVLARSATVASAALNTTFCYTISIPLMMNCQYNSILVLNSFLKQRAAPPITFNPYCSVPTVLRWTSICLKIYYRTVWVPIGNLIRASREVWIIVMICSIFRRWSCWFAAIT